MASFLHLLKTDSAPIAASAIAASTREPGAVVTVVVLDGAAPPELPAGVCIRRLGAGDLDYAELLDLIWSHDHVVSW